MESQTLKLIYPQWQGGNIAEWFKDIPDNDISKGYALGAKLLEILTSNASYQTCEIPISMDFKRVIKDGILDKEVILKQTQSAIQYITEANPTKILTLGGECSVSVAPFSYLAGKYGEDLALLWLDAHPDIGLPFDTYQGYHAMAVTHLLGLGDKEILNLLPASFNVKNILIAGLHSDEAKFYAKRIGQLNLQTLNAKRIKKDKTSILESLKTTKATKIAIHLDLDVLDPKELYIAVGNTGKLKLKHITEILTMVSKNYEVVGFSIAELMPKELIQLQSLLRNLPL